MRRYNERINKQPKTNYFEYELYENEPKIRKNYNVTPEFENGLLDYSYFLKRRVWRQMKKVQKQYPKPVFEHHYDKPRTGKVRTLHHKPAHIF